MYWFLIGLATVLQVIFSILLSVTLIKIRQSARKAHIEPYSYSGEKISRIAVVYFSRSGNTALAASHIANHQKRCLFRPNTSHYPLFLYRLAYTLKNARQLKEHYDALP